MKIINRFLMTRFFSGFGIVILTVAGIIFSITFVERLPSNPSVWAAVTESWMRLLEYIPLFLPPAVFMGTLLSAYRLTKSSESVIISGAGRSPYQQAKPFLIGAALIGILTTTVINPYATRLSNQNITAAHLQLTDGAIWLRENSADGFITIVAKNIAANSENLTFYDVTVFHQDTEFKLKTRTEAEIMSLADDGLSTATARIWNERGIIKTGEYHLKTALNPRTVLDRYLQPDQISFWKMPAFIKKMDEIGAPTRGHFLQFFTLLFLPLTLVAMTTLGVAFSQTRQRRGFNFGLKFSFGILACFASYFLTNMMVALGSTGALPPLVSVALMPLIIIAIAGAFIASFDTI